MTSELILAPKESRVVGQLSSALLYEGIDRASGPLAELLTAGAISAGIPLHRTYLAPAPLPPYLLREYGYDPHTLLATAMAGHLNIPCAQHLLTASRFNGQTMFGIGTPGHAASANLIAFVSVHALGRSNTQQLARLARAACAHADIIFLSCIG